VRRAFIPLGLVLVHLACQWPVSNPSPSSASASAYPASAVDPCSESSRGAEPLDSELPDRAGDFCLDRFAPPSSYGEGSDQSLERACERVLGPSCREQERAGLRRVVRFHYVQRQDPSGSVDGVLSLFGEPSGAYAHFTSTVVGDGDPAELTATALDERNLVQRGDSVFAWRGRQLLWLRHADQRQTSAQREQAALATLPGLARAVLGRLGDSDALPAAVQRLPELDRLPLGVRLLLEDAFGVPGLGPVARGHYRDGDKRWRAAALVRSDAEAAEDVIRTLAQQAEARPIANAPLEAWRMTERRSSHEPALSWVIARRAEVVYGIGDEPTAALEPERGDSVALTLQEKLSKLLGAQEQ
jgi:hypothetical protein